jgi:hypothetical protein
MLIELIVISKYFNKHLEMRTHWKVTNAIKHLRIVSWCCKFLDAISTFFKGFRYFNVMAYLVSGKYPSLTYTLANINATSSVNSISNSNYLGRSIIIRHLLDSLLELLNILNIKGVSSLISFVSQTSSTTCINNASFKVYLWVL